MVNTNGFGRCIIFPLINASGTLASTVLRSSRHISNIVFKAYCRPRGGKLRSNTVWQVKGTVKTRCAYLLQGECARGAENPFGATRRVVSCARFSNSSLPTRKPVVLLGWNTSTTLVFLCFLPHRHLGAARISCRNCKPGMRERTAPQAPCSYLK